MNLTFLDTETTSTEDGRLVELAYAAQIDGQPWGVHYDIKEVRVRPPVAIEYDAMAVHHITELDVLNLPYFVDHPYYEIIKRELEESVVVAHRAPFDVGVLAREGIVVAGHIDTKRVAKHLWPDMFKHKLQYLRYALKLEPFFAEGPEPIVPHQAKSDVMVLAALFRKIMLTIEDALITDGCETDIHEAALEKVTELSSKPVLVKYCDYKKHRGETWEEIARTDRDYLVFFLGKDDIEEDLKYTVRYWLDQPIRL